MAGGGGVAAPRSWVDQGTMTASRPTVNVVPGRADDTPALIVEGTSEVSDEMCGSSKPAWAVKLDPGVWLAGWVEC